MSLNIAITGGTGFIGNEIIKNLLSEGFKVYSLQRSLTNTQHIKIRYIDLSSLKTIKKETLSNIDILIHAAALVHNTKIEPIRYMKMNFEATKILYNIAKKTCVKKFIFLSSVSVYGLNSSKSKIDVYSPTNPITEYAKSKLLAEKFLLSRFHKNIKVSVIRFPLVYGENAPGNYGLLEKICGTKIPLPFSNINNRRSLISITYLAKTITKACKNLDLYQGLCLIADKTPISTKQLIINLRSRSGNPPNLFPVPKILMKIILIILGKKKIYEQLYEDMVYINSKE